MSIEGAAKLQGVSDTVSRKRALGMIKIPPEAAALVRLMLALKIDPSEALRLTASGGEKAGSD